MRFSIVTPSLGQLQKLECCVASVADQTGIEVEHIIQDGGTEGFAEFCRTMARRWPDRPGYRRIMVAEKDRGMYDAINRGLARAHGPICAYLNCDEQYLPGVLAKIGQAFSDQPRTDLLFGDAIVLQPDGEPLCWRKFLVPGIGHTWTCHFSALSAAMFFRKALWDGGLRFDPSFRTAADAVWYLAARRQGARAVALGFFTSTFMETGENLGLQLIAQEERERLTRSAPGWVRSSWWLWFGLHRFRRWLAGCWRQRSLDYAIYLTGRTGRALFHSSAVPGHWPGRWQRI